MAAPALNVPLLLAMWKPIHGVLAANEKQQQQQVVASQTMRGSNNKACTRAPEMPLRAATTQGIRVESARNSLLLSL